VICGSAFKNKGVQPMLDAVVDYLPSPLDVPPTMANDPNKNGELVERPAKDEAPFSALGLTDDESLGCEFAVYDALYAECQAAFPDRRAPATLPSL